MKYLFILVSFCFLSCSHRTAVPQNFATYDSPRWTHAVHPDGIVYRVKIVDNKEKGDLSFWSKAVETRMLKSGYKLVESKDILIKNKKATAFIFTTPFGNRDYQYIIAFQVIDDEILLAEVAGPTQAMLKEEKSILESISKIEL